MRGFLLKKQKFNEKGLRISFFYVMLWIDTKIHLYRMTKARILVMDDMEMMENDNIILLTDEDGVDVEFEFCASVEYEGNEYVVLLPTEDDDGEVVILQVMEDEDAGEDDEATYVGVDDEDVLQAVFEIFKEQAGDEFDFEE